MLCHTVVLLGSYVGSHWPVPTERRMHERTIHDFLSRIRRGLLARTAAGGVVLCVVLVSGAVLVGAALIAASSPLPIRRTTAKEIRANAKLRIAVGGGLPFTCAMRLICGSKAAPEKVV